MAYIGKHNYKEQAAVRQMNPWIEPAVLPVPQEQPRAQWVSGFVRAARQTASPATAREFFRELDASDPLLSRLGWALLAVVPVFAAMAFLASGSLTGVNPWIKPIKFSISFSTFAFTISLFLTALRIPGWQLKLARRVIAGSVALEIASLGAQAWRTAHAVAGQTWIDGSLAQMTNSMVMVNTAIVIGILALYCANRVKVQMVDVPMMAAIRYSIGIFLAGNAIGGYMLARGSHTVGTVDGGPGLPFVNWSTIAGDLRIAHFIAIHAIQIVPLFAYVLAQMAPIPTVKQRRIAVAAVAVAVALAVGATFVQAAVGMPFLPIH